MTYKNIKEGLTFDDVLLIPDYSDIKSRKDINISSELVDGLNLDLPIISANMNKVTEHEMISAICEKGGTGALHRFMNPQEIYNEFTKVESSYRKKAGISIGVDNSVYIEVLSKFKSIDIPFIIIDVAHGDHILVKETIEYLRRNYNDLKIIAGNIATSRAAVRLIEWGVDAVKVGIGPGSACTTRIVTGFGVPQLHAIFEVSNAVKEINMNEGTNYKVIADGGIRYSGDIIKAIAAGADTVMIGGMFAGTKETPGDVLTIGQASQKKIKVFEGMASIDAQASFFGLNSDEIIPEGAATLVPYKGTVKDILDNLKGAIRYGLSYAGCKNIEEFHEYGREDASWIRITNAGRLESVPHGVNE